MARRYLRDGILTSEGINSLAPPAELFYRRLMSAIDDYGLFDGRTAILRASCYQLQLDKVREADIGRWIAECMKPAVLVFYEICDKPYLWMPNTRFLKRSLPKFPIPSREFIKSSFPTLDKAWADDFAQLSAHCAQVGTNAPECRDSTSTSTPPKPPKGGGGDSRRFRRGDRAAANKNGASEALERLEKAKVTA